jgi:hypothetical protein
MAERNDSAIPSLYSAGLGFSDFNEGARVIKDNRKETIRLFLRKRQLQEKDEKKFPPVLVIK